MRDFFSQEMGKAFVPDRYIDIFQGRAPKNVLAKHYNPHGIKMLKEIRLLKLQPKLYEIFIKTAQQIIKSPFMSNLTDKKQVLLKEIKELEKKVVRTERLFGKDRLIKGFKIVTVDGKEIP